ncbi:MAG: hypothetical protein NC349_08240 [Paenibacillus sp.]|nr:hypothetical protein [Paenibacillus sp.]
MALVIVGCKDNNEENIVKDDDKTENVTTPAYDVITTECSIGTISNPTEFYAGCKIESIVEQTEISDGKILIKSNSNDCVQTFFISEGDDVYMAVRTPVFPNTKIEFNAESTALALVMMNPLYSPLQIDSYDEVYKRITNSQAYTSLLYEVEKLIKAKHDILDENNTEMIMALGNLMEDLLKDFNPDKFDGSGAVVLDPISSGDTQSRGNYTNPNIYPISASIYGNKLVLKNTGLTPSYYGSVTLPDGGIQEFSVITADDWGIRQWVLHNQIHYGSETEFYFDKEGEYKFNLSRTNNRALLDMCLRIGYSTITTLGLAVNDPTDFTQFIINNCGSLLITIRDEDIWGILRQVSTTVCDYLSSDHSENLIKNGKWKNIQRIGKIGSRFFLIYNTVKGTTNIINRIAYCLESPEELNFCLCYYDNEVGTCTTAKLFVASGDNQTGQAEKKLLLPLKVYIQTKGDDGMYYESSSYHKIQFKVLEGNGHLTEEVVSAEGSRVAETEWYLGKEGDQLVEAVIIDLITNTEISDPVYFKATITEADVTIRLDWSSDAKEIDLDLHVVDPYGERIWYDNMKSASGGELDRDDTSGPGPEHVTWKDAPVGNYKIYVHYYDSDEDSDFNDYDNRYHSVVQYKVTVSADEIDYLPKSGFIAYDEMVPVGQFIVGGSKSRTDLDDFNTWDLNDILKSIRGAKKRNLSLKH